MSQSASDLIMGGGAPAAKFPTIGTVVRGEILEATTSQQRDFATGEPKVWKDGQPMMQAVITIQTDGLVDENTGPDDDGKRRLFVASRFMREAVRQAVQTAGRKTIEVGGQLAIKYTGDGQAEGNLNPPKLYQAEYKPPAPGAVSADLLGDGDLSEPF